MTVRAKSSKSRPVVTMLEARAHFGSLLDRVASENSSVVISKRGSARAILMSLHEYARLAAPEPEILRLIGERSRRNGTDKLTMKQIDAEIRAARAERKRA